LFNVCDIPFIFFLLLQSLNKGDLAVPFSGWRTEKIGCAFKWSFCQGVN